MADTFSMYSTAQGQATTIGRPSDESCASGTADAATEVASTGPVSGSNQETSQQESTTTEADSVTTVPVQSETGATSSVFQLQWGPHRVRCPLGMSGWSQELKKEVEGNGKAFSMRSDFGVGATWRDFLSKLDESQSKAVSDALLSVQSARAPYLSPGSYHFDTVIAKNIGPVHCGQTDVDAELYVGLEWTDDATYGSRISSVHIADTNAERWNGWQENNLAHEWVEELAVWALTLSQAGHRPESTSSNFGPLRTKVTYIRDFSQYQQLQRHERPGTPDLEVPYEYVIDLSPQTLRALITRESL